MADDLMQQIRDDGKSIRTITVKVRYNDMAEDQRSESLTEPTALETDLYPRLRPMLKQLETTREPAAGLAEVHQSLRGIRAHGTAAGCRYPATRSAPSPVASDR